MGLDSTTAPNTLSQFLVIWPASSISTMTIEQYADLSDHKAFCYLMEYGSRDLGEIGGMPLTKFGLWKYKNKKDFADTYLFDDTYAWNGKFGQKRTLAFKNIIQTITSIVNAATNREWDKIEDIEFHAVIKWKIAFIYSNKYLIPIYTREALLKVSAALGGRFAEDSPIVDLQLFIVSKRPENIDTVAFSQELLEHYVQGKPFRNYFIVGSKYKGDDGQENKDVYPAMLASSSVAIGFLSDHDLSGLYGRPEEEINQFVAANSRGDEIDVNRLKAYFRILLHLKPGDIIAVKSQGSYSNLKIVAYAVVVERNGKVYEYKPTLLGHHINVEFVETGISRQLGFNYAGTIHQISPDKVDHLEQIFGPFLQVDNIALGSESLDEDQLDEQKWKNEDSYERGPIAAKMIRQLHNIIQNHFCKMLKRQYPLHEVKIEYENRVDILRDSGDERWLYEIKPFENVIACLRQATGQLIEYAYRFQDPDKKINLVIVGPGALSVEARNFLDHFAEVVKLPLSYEQHVVPNRQNKT